MGCDCEDNGYSLVCTYHLYDDDNNRIIGKDTITLIARINMTFLPGKLCLRLVPNARHNAASVQERRGGGRGTPG
ncbi:50S ribosomal protein L16 [Dissostichus eleginoides]|uniref:50S ribosomal protein L16 n=1 Tax=Dissostichus eleginoides TaxID=100907 RepID=A0AAD9CL48_DISEL|nr:50S ribosomal protein L16 [Dissostichus eleginoides]